MGKSKKKSASEVAAAPASPPASPPAKPLKKGKREAEDAIESELVSAKKQKSHKKRVESEQKPGKPDSESHSDISEVAVAASPSNGRSAKKSKSKKAKSAVAKKAEEEIEDEEVQEEKMEASPEKSSPAPMIPEANEIDATPKEQSTGGGSKTLLVRNISRNIEKEDILEFFKPAGEVVDFRLARKTNGKLKGYGHVEFATAEQAQKALLELNGEELLDRPVILQAQKEVKLGEGNTLFVKHISLQAQKEDVLEFFKPAGEVVGIRFAMRKGDSFKGYGHVEFATVEDADRALLELNGKRLLKRIASLAKEETDLEGKTLVFKNFAYHIQKEEVLEFFETAGKVVDVRMAMRIGDSFRGYGHVDFATPEQAHKALQELNGKVLLDREVKLIIAREPKRREYRRPFERKPELEVFVTGFDAHAGEANIRASLMDHFACCGEIARVTIPAGPFGHSVGLAFVQFMNEDARSKALELGTETMVVEVPRPKTADSNSGGTEANTTMVGAD